MRETLEVRGYTALDRPAPWRLRILALGTDLGWILGLLWIVLRASKLPPLPELALLGAWVAACALAYVLQQLLLSGTVGSRLWALGRYLPERGRVRTPLQWLRSKLIQTEAIELDRVILAAPMTLALLIGSISALDSRISGHPLWVQAGYMPLEPFAPAGEGWKVAPFFYSIGAWPSSYAGRPVLWRLPYEKGPPHHFVGHIVARWESPDVELTLEGPFTPAQGLSAAEVRDCMLSGLPGPGCLRMRSSVLGKHLAEVERQVGGAPVWSIRWFEVENPSIPEDERPRGVFLSGEGETRAQDRWILVLPRGRTQAIVLDRPLGARGRLARSLLEQSVRSQRVASDLNPGRAWADRELQSVRLDEITAGGTPPEPAKTKAAARSKPQEPQPSTAEQIARLAEVQSTLLSKISVDPRSFDAYYHLGGVSFLMARQALRDKNLDWSATAKPMLRSALRYAQDINPRDNRTAQLENLWLDVARF